MGFDVSVVADIFKFPWPLFPKYKNSYQMGFRLDIPPTPHAVEYIIKLPLDNKYELHTFAFSASGYRDADYLSLYRNDDILLQRIYTKELGQVKDIRPVKKIIPEEDVLKFVFHNTSGTSKVVWVDLDFTALRQVKKDDPVDPTPPIPGPDPEPGEYLGKVYVLLIGNNDYDLNGTVGDNGDLFGCVNDTLRNKNLFENFFNSHYKVETVMVKTNQTKEQMLTSMDDIIVNAKIDDIVVMCYSGHGDAMSGMGYIVGCVSGASSYANSYISAQDIHARLGKFTGTKLVFFDCCHSGAMINKSLQFKSGLEILNEEYNEEYDIEEETQSFEYSQGVELNNLLLKSFYLNTPSYKVLTATHSSQVGYDLPDGNPLSSKAGGIFTMIIELMVVRGQWLSIDTSLTKKISMMRIYTQLQNALNNLFGGQFGSTGVNPTTVQLHPIDDSFTVFEITDSNSDIKQVYP